MEDKTISDADITNTIPLDDRLGKTLLYACCFCAQPIKETDVDPSALILVLDWQHDDKYPKAQNSQQFFCHVECLLDLLHPEVRITWRGKPSGG